MKKAPFFIILLVSCTIFPLVAQKKIKVTGTGNTTGHIANLTIENKGKSPIDINEQTAFIPSDGKYQPYIVTIPGTTVPPGTTTIPLTGYCADVTKPPVPTGDGMPPVADWIAVEPGTRPGPGDGSVDIVETKVPPFTIADIPGITVSSGYTPKPPPGVPDIQLTWPGSDIIIGGELDPDTDPETVAPVLIDALENITNAFDSLRRAGGIGTPFSGNPEKERESVIQQTFWIFAGGLTGERYQKENFATKVIDQYERNVGISVANIPEPERKKLDEGVDAFWNTFMATGVEAKIIRAPEATTTGDIPIQSTPGEEPPFVEPKDRNCICNNISVQVTITHEFEGRTITDVSETVTLTDSETEMNRNVTDVVNEQELTISLSSFDVQCSCSYGSAICQDYGSRNEKGELGNRDEVKIRITGNENCDIVEKPTPSAKPSFTVKIKSKPPKKDGVDGVRFDVIITAHCKSDDCNPGRSDKCEKTLKVKLTKADE